MHKAATLGDDACALHLGTLYRRDDRHRDAEEAWTLAAERGSAEAMSELAMLAAKRENLRGARRWHERAIGAGHDDPSVRLAIHELERRGFV